MIFETRVPSSGTVGGGLYNLKNSREFETHRGHQATGIDNKAFLEFYWFKYPDQPQKRPSRDQESPSVLGWPRLNALQHLLNPQAHPGDNWTRRGVGGSRKGRQIRNLVLFSFAFIIIWHITIHIPLETSVQVYLMLFKNLDINHLKT